MGKAKGSTGAADQAQAAEGKTEKPSRAELFAAFREVDSERKAAEAALAEIKDKGGAIVDQIVKYHGAGPFKYDGSLIHARKEPKGHYQFSSMPVDQAPEV